MSLGRSVLYFKGRSYTLIIAPQYVYLEYPVRYLSHPVRSTFCLCALGADTDPAFPELAPIGYQYSLF